MIRKVILTSWRHKRRKRLWWDIKLGGRSEITAKSRRLFVPRRIPSPLPIFLPPPTKSLFVFVFVFLQTSTLLTVISKRISLSNPFFHFWLFGLNMCLTLVSSISAVRFSLFNIPFFCDISQAQYFHLYQIATSFFLKFFLSSLPRISKPHLLSLSTSLSDFLNFQHFFCKYFCYATKLFFNTTFTKLFSTLLSQSFFQHFFHTIFFSTPFA